MLPDKTFPVLTTLVGCVVMGLSDDLTPVILILGESGVGKSHAVDQALRSIVTARLVVKARPKMRARSLAEEMLREATENPLFSLGGRILSHDQLAEIVTDELYEDDTLIVIEDAHVLSTNALAWLADLQARDVARLVLIGDPSLTERLPEQLCRVARSILFEPLSDEKVAWLVPQLHPIYMCAKQATILEINRRYCEGNLARWARFTEHAAHTCSHARIRFVNDSVVNYVLDALQELDEAA